MKSCLQHKKLRKTQCSCTLTASCQQSWSHFSTSHFAISMLSRWSSDYTLLVLLPEPMPKAAVKATLDLQRSATSATVLDDHYKWLHLWNYTFWTMNIWNIPMKCLWNEHFQHVSTAPVWPVQSGSHPGALLVRWAALWMREVQPNLRRPKQSGKKKTEKNRNLHIFICIFIFIPYLLMNIIRIS